jgi:hypothetical protein
MPRPSDSSSTAQRPPPRGAAVNHGAVVRQRPGREAVPTSASWKHATTSAALNTALASEATSSRERSSSTLELGVGAVCEGPVRDVGLPPLVDITASNRTNELRGRFCG